MPTLFLFFFLKLEKEKEKKKPKEKLGHIFWRSGRRRGGGLGGGGRRWELGLVLGSGPMALSLGAARDSFWRVRKRAF